MASPKRLIEVDLPIGRISAHARREKSIRHGHISTLHIWWARRPLAACRAVVLAALWPDPADEECPAQFRAAVAQHLAPFWERRGRRRVNWNDPTTQRQALLDFIADFADWQNSADPEFLRVARALVTAAHEALGGEPGTKPLVVDPFAGGGAIPLEALRVGADAFASDLNPVAVLLNKVVLEYAPRYGQELAEAVRHWGAWVKARAEEDIGRFYPRDPDGSTPIAYIWARTIRCEGPGCGAEVPLMRSLWLSKRHGRRVALEVDSEAARRGRVEFRIRDGSDGRPVTEASVGSGTVRRGSATCPCCGYTTPVARVREQLRRRRGGTADARLVAVVTTHPMVQGRFYRLPTKQDLDAVRAAEVEFAQRQSERLNGLPAVPGEPLPLMSGVFNVPIYGIDTWGNLFTPRQLLVLITFAKYVREATERLCAERGKDFARAVGACLALALDRQADYLSSICRWHTTGEKVSNTFGRQALPIVWDFTEVNPFSGATGDWDGAIEWVSEVCSVNAAVVEEVGQALAASATDLPLPDGLAQALITDPPYYNSVPYADLSDFFYVWLRRTVGDLHPDLFKSELTPKDEEIAEMSGWDPVRYPHKDSKFFERKMREALTESRRVLTDDGIGVVVFAHKSTTGWEAMLQALIDAGWTITGSWPIDTEMSTRLRARNSAALASSVHLSCRPRTSQEVGDWRDVLEELPRRVHEWLPRLAREGIMGADAIFACLGPALEIFSRYARVEKPSGEAVRLSEYLEQVWAAVAKEALGVIFKGADASGFEEDSRLTAMWLWTLFAGNGQSELASEEDSEEAVEEEGEQAGTARNGKVAGYVLDYDTARKIAQGLGVHLEALSRPGGVVEVRGETARLVSVRERERALFGDRRTAGSRPRGRKAKQLTFFENEEMGSDKAVASSLEFVPGTTVLDRLHQSMLLFARGRTDGLRRLLVDEGAGRDARFWRLAQALSALYPRASEEKRWVDGVLASRRMFGL